MASAYREASGALAAVLAGKTSIRSACYACAEPRKALALVSETLKVREPLEAALKASGQHVRCVFLIEQYGETCPVCTCAARRDRIDRRRDLALNERQYREVPASDAGAASRSQQLVRSRRGNVRTPRIGALFCVGRRSKLRIRRDRFLPDAEWNPHTKTRGVYVRHRR